MVVEVHGHVEALRHLATERASEADAVTDGDPEHGHERDHIGGAHARMPAPVLAHVDPLDRYRGPGHRARPHGIGVAEHRRVEPVVVGVGLGVDDASAGHVQRIDDRIDHVGATALAEVRDDAVELLDRHAVRIEAGGGGGPPPPTR